MSSLSGAGGTSVSVGRAAVRSSAGATSQVGVTVGGHSTQQPGSVSPASSHSKSISAASAPEEKENSTSNAKATDTQTENNAYTPECRVCLAEVSEVSKHVTVSKFAVFPVGRQL